MKRTIILIAIVAAGCGETDRVDPARDTARATPHAAVAPEAIEASLAAAEEYFHTRDLAKARAILLRLLDRAPGEPRALELHGQLLMAMAIDAGEAGDQQRRSRLFGEAYEQYRTLLKIEPHSAGLHQSAGEVAHVAGRPEDALQHYRQAHRLNPQDTKAPFFAAQVLIEQSDYDEAIGLLERVLQVDPDEPMVHASLANIAVQQNRFDDALEHIAEARAIQRGNMAFRVIEASIHRKRGQPQGGLDLLIGLSPHDRGRWFVAEELAALHMNMGEPQLAAQAWAHVHRSNPSDARSWLAAVRAGEASLAAGNREEAWLWLQEARILAPDATETQALARSFLQHNES